MKSYSKYEMKHGAILIAVEDYTNDEAFGQMMKELTQIIEPDDWGYSVDSMCIGGYFRKDGILIRTSSECPYDCCAIFYEPSKMTEQEVEKTEEWIRKFLEK